MGMRILVVGAGAVGGYFGGRLAEAGRDVTFLVRSRTADNIRRDGLRIVSPHGDATLHPKVVLANEITAPYDLILLSVKAYGLESAMDDFAPAVGHATMILPVLNGMRHIDLLIAKFGEDAVLGGVCLVATEVDQNGRIVQLADMQKLIYGERNGGYLRPHQGTRPGHAGSRLRRKNLREHHAGHVGEVGATRQPRSRHLPAARQHRRGRSSSRRHQNRTKDTRRMQRHRNRLPATLPRDPFLAQARTMLTTPGSSMTSSMYRDMTKGSRVEADQILGDLIDRGRNLRRRCTARRSRIYKPAYLPGAAPSEIARPYPAFGPV